LSARSLCVADRLGLDQTLDRGQQTPGHKDLPRCSNPSLTVSDWDSLLDGHLQRSLRRLSLHLGGVEPLGEGRRAQPEGLERDVGDAGEVGAQEVAVIVEPEGDGAEL
jgi:hypothetical protein